MFWNWAARRDIPSMFHFSICSKICFRPLQKLNGILNFFASLSVELFNSNFHIRTVLVPQTFKNGIELFSSWMIWERLFFMLRWLFWISCFMFDTQRFTPRSNCIKYRTLAPIIISVLKLLDSSAVMIDYNSCTKLLWDPVPSQSFTLSYFSRHVNFRNGED